MSSLSCSAVAVRVPSAPAPSAVHQAAAGIACLGAGRVRVPFLAAGLGRRAGRSRSGASLADLPIPRASGLALRPPRPGAAVSGRARASGEGLPEGLGARRLQLHEDASSATPEQRTRVDPRGSGERLVEGHGSWASAESCAVFLHQAACTGWLILRHLKRSLFKSRVPWHDRGIKCVD